MSLTKGLRLLWIGMAIAILCFGLTACGQPAKEPDPTPVGSWVEDSSGLSVEFTDDGVFRLMSNDTANFTLDEENKVIVLKYAEAYGGKELTMAYHIVGNAMTLIDQDTQVTHHYSKPK